MSGDLLTDYNWTYGGYAVSDLSERLFLHHQMHLISNVLLKENTLSGKDLSSIALQLKQPFYDQSSSHFLIL